MAILVSAQELKKSFGARPLFENLSFVVESGERVGLIGPNGAGKSTLLRILAQKTNPDGGEITFQKGLRVGFLEQSPELPLSETVEKGVVSGLGASPSDDGMLLAGELLSRLELSPFTDKKIETLSGGWRKRVALARELVKSPDLLLLDEPTNHLDIESILWLETFLERSSCATVTVTHDRLFLKRVTNRILELDRRNPQGLLSVKGDYETYVQRKSELLALTQKQYTVLSNTLRRETEWLRQGAKARTTKQQARIQAAGELKDRVEELNVRNQKRTASLEFQSSEKKPKRLVEATEISKRYGQKSLFEKLDVFLGPGDRLGLLGVNGCGKSTLIRVLLGIEPEDSGKVYRSENLKVAYFSQNREALDPQVSLRKTLCPHGDQVNYRGKMVHINSYLDRFLFSKEQIDLPIARLSGGEQSRVLIAQLMLKEANLLVLDEPTNDLDVETLDVLQDCLTDFDGALVLVTHDRYFLDQVATQILAFPTPGMGGAVTSFADLNQWETWLKDQKKAKEPVATQAPKPAERTRTKKLGFNETRELAGMEAKIHGTEEKLRLLKAESESPEIQSNAKKLSEVFQALAETESELSRLYDRWAELEAMKG